MIADLKPYPAYKDSGVPWLGEVIIRKCSSSRPLRSTSSIKRTKQKRRSLFWSHGPLLFHLFP